MPTSTRAKRKSSEKDSSPKANPSPTSPKAPRSKRSQKTPRAERPAPQPTPGAATLTRRRAQALGEEPAPPQDEPERFLQQKSREQARSAQKNEAPDMERRPGSGGRVSYAALFTTFTTFTPTHNPLHPSQDAGDDDDGPVPRR
jgi:hypothetical protein